MPPHRFMGFRRIFCQLIMINSIISCPYIWIMCHDSCFQYWNLLVRYMYMYRYVRNVQIVGKRSASGTHDIGKRSASGTHFWFQKCVPLALRFLVSSMVGKTRFWAVKMELSKGFGPKRSPQKGLEDVYHLHYVSRHSVHCVHICTLKSYGKLHR